MANKIELPAGIPTSFTRNGVKVDFITDTFGKKSEKLAGTPFLTPKFEAPELKELTLADGSKIMALVNVNGFIWQGIDDLNNSNNAVLRRTAMDIWIESRDEETGIFDVAEFTSQWNNFTAARELLSDVEDQIESLQNKLQDLLSPDSDFKGTGDELIALSKAISSQIRPLKEKAAAISARYAVRAAARKAKKEAAAAKTTATTEE